MGYWVGVPSRAAEGGERLLRPPRSPATAAPLHQERRTAANLTGADIEAVMRSSRAAGPSPSAGRRDAEGGRRLGHSPSLSAS